MQQNASTARPPQPKAPPLFRGGSAERLGQGQALVLEAIDRIEALVESETSALQTFKAIDLQDFNNRKNQLLLEMTRAVRALNGAPPDAPVTGRLKGLREKLAGNQAVLAMHLRAAREITNLVADTIRDSESDGTYSNSASYGSKSPW
ncbi:hypothetical protein BH10PSE7_BH10PSE7_31040 [soil metagenome]